MNIRVTGPTVRRLLAAALLAVGLAAGSGAIAATMDNLFFLHHSTGRGLIQGGDMRGWLADYNAQHGSSYVFWDHDYNYIGLTDPDGNLTGTSYNIPDDNTDPDGLHTLWTTDNAARAAILANHQVIAFKSCFPASHIASDAELAQRKQWYLEMRDFFDQHPEKVFVVVSQPPLHRNVTNLDEADRARAFADWLKSAEYLSGHPNVACIDLFDMLAAPDDGSDTRNMLRYEYELSHSGTDSHPNALANQTVGPLFIQALVLAAETRSQSSTGVGAALPPTRVPLRGAPNPFNPRTTIHFDLPQDLPVRLAVYGLDGTLVKVLAEGTLAAGAHAATWDGTAADGRAVPSGVYLVRLSGAAHGGERLTLVR